MSALLKRNRARNGQAASRRFIFLQGPASPFFARLGRLLRARGHDVQRINLSLGDQLFWRGGGSTAYRGRFSRWSEYLARRLDEEGTTDIVLFGDCRSYHRTAIELARTRGISVHVFEEGYLRPNWLTLEMGGVNGYSHLPEDPEDIRRLAATARQRPTLARVGSGMRNRVVWDLTYNLSTTFGRLLFPFYLHHRPWPVLIEYGCWLKRLAMMPLEKRRSRSTLARLATSEPGFFIFPLQLDSDFQIRVHSDIRSMEEALQLVIGSFAAHAPATDHLVVKAHPLDNGLVDRRKQCRRIAAAAGVEDRVLFIDGGNLGHLTRDAKGMVTVNSTSGMIALEHGRPVAVLGRAVYHIRGLTHFRGLDSFWTDNQRPDPELLAAFIALMKDRALINGSFFTEAGLAAAVEGALERIEAVAPSPIPTLDEERQRSRRAATAAALRYGAG